MSDCLTITLVRHGASAHPFRDWLTLVEFRNWIAEYNQAGISTNSFPQESLVQAAATTGHVICSDYPCALESARRLAPAAIPDVTPILREAGRPLSWNCRVPMPFSMWNMVSSSLWRAGLSHSDESIFQARTRAEQATKLLIESAEKHRQIVVVGHGTFNSMISDELLRKEWKGPKRPRFEHWGFAVYRLEAS